MSDMIAMEAFLRDQIIIENEDKLNQRYPLFVFCETDATLFVKKFSQLARKYGFKDVVVVNFDDLENYLMHDVSIDWPPVNDIQERFDQLKERMTNDMSLHDLYMEIVEVCIEHSKKHNSLMMLLTSNYYNYADRGIKECPILLLNPSRIKLAINSFKTSKRTDHHFNRAFGTKINKKLYVKNPEKLKLFHVSMVDGIKELTPRRTYKPLNDYENMIIPRISAASSVDACFRAVSPRVGTWHVYQLILTKQSTVVKPDTYLVPDADVTGEYWILTPTKVKEIAVIECREDPQDKERFLFTTIKSTTNDDYENLLRGIKVVSN